jgi:hypothetical protein
VSVIQLLQSFLLAVDAERIEATLPNPKLRIGVDGGWQAQPGSTTTESGTTAAKEKIGASSAES